MTDELSRRQFTIRTAAGAGAMAAAGLFAPVVRGAGQPGAGGALSAVAAASERDRSKIMASQDFNWHDAGHGATYVFGEDGYLKMDGSAGKVECSRRLKKPIKGPDAAMELRLRVVLGKRYHIRLLDAADRPAVDCRIDENGRLKFARQGQYVDSGRVLTFQRGTPFADPAKRKWYVVESDEHCFRFHRFDFAEGKFALVLDGAEPVVMAGCLDKAAAELCKLQLQTCSVEVGSMIRLREYAEYAGEALVEREDFPLHWKPVPPPPKGMPDDNVRPITARPVDYRWLETSTEYGYLKVRIPSLPKGALEFEMKALSAWCEHCLVLEQDEGIIKGGSIQLGLLHNKMKISTDKGMMTVDQPTEIADNRIYKIKIAWDKDARTCRFWVDGSLMTCNGSGVLTMPSPPRNGIDTITLHPGLVGKGPKGQKMPPVLRTYWGKFRIYDLGP